MCVQPFSHVWLVATPWAVAFQAPLSMEFSRQLLKWIAFSYFGGSSWPRDWTRVSWVSCIGRWILYHCAIFLIRITEIIIRKNRRIMLNPTIFAFNFKLFVLEYSFLLNIHLLVTFSSKSLYLHNLSLMFPLSINISLEYVNYIDTEKQWQKVQ